MKKLWVFSKYGGIFSTVPVSWIFPSLISTKLTSDLGGALPIIITLISRSGWRFSSFGKILLHKNIAASWFKAKFREPKKPNVNVAGSSEPNKINSVRFKNLERLIEAKQTEVGVDVFKDMSYAIAAHEIGVNRELLSEYLTHNPKAGKSLGLVKNNMEVSDLAQKYG